MVKSAVAREVQSIVVVELTKNDELWYNVIQGDFMVVADLDLVRKNRCSECCRPILGQFVKPSERVLCKACISVQSKRNAKLARLEALRHYSPIEEDDGELQQWIEGYRAQSRSEALRHKGACLRKVSILLIKLSKMYWADVLLNDSYVAGDIVMLEADLRKATRDEWLANNAFSAVYSSD